MITKGAIAKTKYLICSLKTSLNLGIRQIFFGNFFYKMNFYNNRKDAMAKAKVPTLCTCWELLQFGAISESCIDTKVDIWKQGYM